MAYPIKKIQNKTFNKVVKILFCLGMCIGFTIAADESGFTNARFICSLVFGYTVQ
jgi:hypothetical protein